LPRAGTGYSPGAPRIAQPRFPEPDPLRPSGRFAGSTAAFDRQTASRPNDAGRRGADGPFDEPTGFPAGGVARYVPPIGNAAPDATAGVGTGSRVDESAGPSGLRRRVPGATAPGGPIDVPAFRELDPDDARALIEQFEAGVARALDETSDHVEGEGRNG
jgi:hypothetical protein